MNIDKVFIGGWFQRTALHLSELYDFLSGEQSPLALDAEKLKQLHKNLRIDTVEMRFAGLQYVHIFSKTGVTAKIFEDGLIILSYERVEEPKKAVRALTTFYENKLSPVFNELFSLGAPVPKELANIKTVYPYFFVLNSETEKTQQNLLAAFNEKEQFTIEEHSGFTIRRGDKLYIINRTGVSLEATTRFIEEQVFLREFRGQLHRYLNLHRIIWERIAEVKERGHIRGSEIGTFKTKIEEYKKTITLIDTRIDQMDAYIKTREAIAKKDSHLTAFLPVIEYRYEALANTLSYIKDIWIMTMRYVDSALKLFSDLQAQSTDASVQNLTVVTSMGVGATLLGLFTTDSAPAFTIFGVIYFLLLAAIGYGANKIMRRIYSERNYDIVDTEIDTNIT